MMLINLLSLGDSCHLMDEKSKLLLEEVIIVENKFQKLWLFINLVYLT